MGGGGRTGHDLIVFVGPSVKHQNFLAFPGGIFESFFARHALASTTCKRFKILWYQSKRKLYFKNGKLHQVENLQRGLILPLTRGRQNINYDFGFCEHMFVDNVKASALGL